MKIEDVYPFDKALTSLMAADVFFSIKALSYLSHNQFSFKKCRMHMRHTKDHTKIHMIIIFALLKMHVNFAY